MKLGRLIAFGTTFYTFSNNVIATDSVYSANLSEPFVGVVGYDDKNFPPGLGWIERVDLPPCSAALTDSDIVLTKASCFYTNYGGNHEPWWHIDNEMVAKSSFKIGYKGQIVGAKILNYTAPDRYIFQDNKKFDLMFVKLDRKIGGIVDCSKIREKISNRQLSLFYFRNDILPGYDDLEFTSEYIQRQCVPGKKITQLISDYKYSCLKNTYDQTFFFSDGILYSKNAIVGLNGVDRSAIPAKVILAYYKQLKDKFNHDDNALEEGSKCKRYKL